MHQQQLGAGEEARKEIERRETAAWKGLPGQIIFWLFVGFVVTSCCNEDKKGQEKATTAAGKVVAKPTSGAASKAATGR